MKYLKIFEDFERPFSHKLSSKQIKISINYIKENHPYVNDNSFIHDIEATVGGYMFNEELCDTLEEALEKGVNSLFKICGISSWEIKRDNDLISNRPFSYHRTITINNGLIDVDGSINIYMINLTKIPLKFGVVKGVFNIRDNKLTTLKGAPHTCNTFLCHNNKLRTLKYGPKNVGGNYHCYDNKLINLNGAPEKISEDFSCFNNKLKTLQGGPKIVSGNFNCSNNNLTNLIGGPEEVGGTYICSENKLVTLEGGPKKVGKHFIFRNNNISSLDFIPKKVRGDIYYGGNDDINILGLDDKKRSKLKK